MINQKSNMSEGNNRKYRNLLNNIGVLTVGNMSSRILVFFLIPLYTSELSTHENGIFDLVYTTIQLICPILTIDISTGVMRFMMDKEAEEDQIVTIAMKYIAISTIVVYIALLSISRMGKATDIRGYEILVLGYYFSYTMNQMLIAYGKGIDKLADIAIAGFVSSFTLVVSNIILLLVYHLGLKGFFISNLLAQIVPMIYYIIRFKIYNIINAKTINKNLEKRLVLYSIPMIIVEIGWVINSAADRYAVAFVCGVSATGILAVSYKIPTILNVIQSIFIQAWHVSGVKEYIDMKTKQSAEVQVFYETVFRYLNFIMSISCAALILLSRVIGKYLFLKDFYDAWRYTPFLLISSLFNALSGFLGAILIGKKKSAYMAYSSIAGIIVNIALNIILINIVGIQGAAIATAISSCIIFAVRYVVSKDILEKREIKYATASWILLCIQAIIAIQVRIMWWQLIPILIIFILYKNKISLNKLIMRTST